jgi:glycyl-tRNA synthetase beta chain
MGGYYARAEGLPTEVADAIRDHYKPVGQGDDVPTAPVTVAVALADKLDTLLSFFDIGEFPTGSKDPYALRRASIAIIRLILTNHLKVHTDSPIELWLGQSDPSIHLDSIAIERRKLLSTALDFLLDRLAVQQRDQGVRHDFVSASRDFGSRDDGRIDRVVRRALALQDFIATPDGINLLAGYKRAANILKKEDWQGIEGEIARTGEEDPLANVDDADLAPVIAAKMAERHAGEFTLSYTPEPAEKALIDALADAGPRAADALAAEDFAAAMAALASLRAPIDAFFEHVTVNDADTAKRAARLALLDRFRAAVHNVADFSRIEG